MPSKMTVMHPGDGPTVVPGTTWSPPIPERPLPHRQGGPLLPQPYALWSPRTIGDENIVYCALAMILRGDGDGALRLFDAEMRAMLREMDRAADRRRGQITEP